MKKLLFIIAILITGIAFSQQQWQYSQYMNNNFMLNPAEAGTEEFADIRIGARAQWISLDGAPTSFFISGHTPFKKHWSRFDDVKPLAFHGLGGYISRDITGPFSRTSAYGSYAYHLPLTKDVIASFGAFFGIKQYELDVNKLEFATDVIDASVTGASTQTMPDGAFGVWVYSPKYYFGVSTFQLFGNQLKFGEQLTEAGELTRHHFLTAGYLIKLGTESRYFLIPSFVAKAAFPAPIQVDLNMKLRYEDKFWTGLSYRNKDAIVLLAGVTIADFFDIGYSYDINLSNLNQYNNGSHEILIGARFHHNEEPVPAQFW